MGYNNKSLEELSPLFIERWNAGVKTPQIAKEFNTSITTVSKWLKRNGINIPKGNVYSRKAWNKGLSGIIKQSESAKEKHRLDAIKNNLGKWERSSEQKEIQTNRLLENHAGGWNKGLKMSPVSEDTRAKLSKSLLKAYAEGRRDSVRNNPRGGKSKWFKYERSDGRVINVQGTYELRFCKVLDTLGWNWKKFDRQRSIEYFNSKSGKIRRYGPDFTVIRGEEILDIEVKGWFDDWSKEKVAAYRKTGRPLLLVDKALLEIYERQVL